MVYKEGLGAEILGKGSLHLVEKSGLFWLSVKGLNILNFVEMCQVPGVLLHFPWNCLPILQPRGASRGHRDRFRLLRFKFHPRKACPPFSLELRWHKAALILPVASEGSKGKHSGQVTCLALAGRGAPLSRSLFCFSRRVWRKSDGDKGGCSAHTGSHTSKDSSAPINLSLWQGLVLGLQKPCHGEFRFYSGSNKSK